MLVVGGRVRFEEKEEKVCWGVGGKRRLEKWIESLMLVIGV